MTYGQRVDRSHADVHHLPRRPVGVDVRTDGGNDHAKVGCRR